MTKRNRTMATLPRHPESSPHETVCVMPHCDASVEDGLDLPLCLTCSIHVMRRVVQYGRTLDGADATRLKDRREASMRNPGDYRQHPKPRPERVYYVQVGDGVKIGTTIDMKKRMVAIRNASPSAKLLATEPGGRSLEHLRHAEFTASRIGNSEVFRPTPQLMAHIDRIALGGK